MGYHSNNPLVMPITMGCNARIYLSLICHLSVRSPRFPRSLRQHRCGASRARSRCTQARRQWPRALLFGLARAAQNRQATRATVDVNGPRRDEGGGVDRDARVLVAAGRQQLVDRLYEQRRLEVERHRPRRSLLCHTRTHSTWQAERRHVLSAVRRKKWLGHGGSHT